MWSTVSVTPHSSSFNLMQETLGFSDRGSATGNGIAALSRAERHFYIVLWVRHERDEYDTDAIDVPFLMRKDTESTSSFAGFT